MRIHLDGVTVDLDARVVRGPGAPAPLTETEARLLAYLAANADRVVPRDELLVEVWGLKKTTVTRCVDVAVHRLRHKIEPDPAEPRHLLKVHGQGYRFDPRGKPAPAAPADVGRTNLPTPSDRFFGREAELDRVRRWLADGASLVAVSGPPGAGRKRFVREAALRYGGLFPGGAWIGEVPEDRPPGRALLVLDEDRERERERADIAVLAAVRTLPDHGERLRLEPLAHDEAVALFVDRAGTSAAEAGARASRSEEDAVHRLIDRLDRLPLAIEAAARRSAVLSPVDLLARLDERLRWLPAVAASLSRATEGLDPTLDDALTSLSAFAGAFDLAAAEAVIGGLAVDVVDALLARSLVQREPGAGPARFRVLETVRARRPVPADARRRHLGWAVSHAIALHRRYRQPDGEAAIRGVLALLDDLRLAHATALDLGGDALVDAVRLVIVLDVPLSSRGPHDVQRALLDATADRAADLPPLWRTRLRTMRGEAFRMQLKLADARAELELALADAVESGDEAEIGEAFGYLAILAHTEQRWDDAADLYRRAIDVAARAKSWSEAHYTANLASLLVQRGKLDDAEPMLRWVLDLRRRQGIPRYEGRARQDLGVLLAHRGRAGEAELHLREALAVAAAGGETRDEAQLHNAIGLLLLDQGRLDEADDAFAASLDRARAVGLLRSEAMALGHRGVLRLFAKDRADRAAGAVHPGKSTASSADARRREGERMLRQSVEVHRRSEQPALAATPLAWLGALEASEDRWVEAEASFAEAEAALADVFAEDTRALVDVLTAALELARGRKKRLDARSRARQRLADVEPATTWSIEVRIASRWVQSLL